LTGKTLSSNPITGISIGSEIIGQNPSIMNDGIPTTLILLPIIVIWLIKTSSKLMLSLNGGRNTQKQSCGERRNEPLHERETSYIATSP
jgi:hypothetical protein